MINPLKSHLVPTSRLLHLGAIIDTSLCKVFLSPERQVSIRTLVDKVRSERKVNLLLLSQLLGKLISCIAIVPWARLHTRNLQWFLLPYQKRGLAYLPHRVRVPSRTLESLRWWLSPALYKGSLFREPSRVTLTTDASLFGWGAHLTPHFAQGRWSQRDLKKSINWLELRAIHLALRHFHRLVTGCHVLVLTDNVAAKAHVNRQGGTRSRTLMAEAQLLGSWAERNLLSLRAEHISGVNNRQADFLSRSTIDHSEWRLHPRLFREITHRFGLPVVDLFASPKNAQLPRFFSRYPSQGAEAADALRSPWPAGLLYAFPPLPLIPAAIRKLLQERAEVLFVAPHWPRRPWFADLVSLALSPPWQIPSDRIVLTQGDIRHPDPQWLQLAVWHLNASF